MNNSLSKYICSVCVGNSEITKESFTTEKKIKTCSYCKKRRLCINLNSLAEAIDDIYRTDYEQCDDGDPPSYIISEMLELDESAGRLDVDLVALLSSEESGSSERKDSESMYDESTTYRSCREKNSIRPDGREHKELWDVFCHKIKHRTRFFNNQVIVLLNQIFLDLDKFGYSDGISPVYEMQPTDPKVVFYRARHAANAQERIRFCCDPSKELSPPPAHFASSGRMNPRGISVFYAAFDPETCLAEIRLPVGETAIIGQFQLENPITIFDLTVLDKLGSDRSLINDSIANNGGDDYEDRLAFLQEFSAEISKPISQDGEALDYMPTQALAEYLAYHYKPNIDAIVYESTQTNGKGKNIVFLKHTAKVVNASNPVAGEYGAMWNDEGYYISSINRRKQGRFDLGFQVDWTECTDITFTDNKNYVDDENKNLSLVKGSLKLYKIKAVEYETECSDVIFGDSK